MSTYRPYPPPTAPYVMHQTWHDLLFMHWRVPVEALRAHIPASLQIDTFDGEAWLAVGPFRMSGIRPRYLPSTKLQGSCSINNSLVTEGCILNAVTITRSVVGVRSRIENGSVIENSLLMGADAYQALPELAREADIVFLSSEPYPFRVQHQRELTALLPDTRIELIDGELVSWYGSRAIAGLRYLRELRAQLTQGLQPAGPG